MGKILAKLCPGGWDNSYTSNPYFQEWKQTLEDKDSQEDMRSSYSSGSGPFKRVAGWRSAEDISKVYIFGRLTGTGGFAKVLLAQPVMLNTTAKLSVVKTIPKSDHLIDSYAMREAEILRKLDHPNVVKFQEVYEDEESFHIILEYLRGGTLLEYLLSQHQSNTSGMPGGLATSQTGELSTAEVVPISPQVVEYLLWQMLVAIAYLHANSIVHGDLKPENFVFEQRLNGSLDELDLPVMKLIDFGLAEVVKKRRKLTIFSGSRYFLAPEVISSSYTEKRDIWSLGVLLYVMLAGSFPFYGNSDKELFSAIQSGIYPQEPLQNAPEHLRTLVASMLSRNPEERWTAAGYLGQEALAKFGRTLCSKSRRMFDQHVLTRVKRRKPLSLTRMEVSYIILSMQADWSPSDKEFISEARCIFLSIDTNYKGVVNFEKLESFLQSISEDPEGDADLILQNSLKQELTYSDWLINYLPEEVLYRPDKIGRVFTWMDVDCDGMVSISDLQIVMARTGRRFTRSQLDLMISEVDTNNDRLWSRMEFLQHFDQQQD